MKAHVLKRLRRAHEPRCWHVLGLVSIAFHVSFSQAGVAPSRGDSGSSPASALTQIAVSLGDRQPIFSPNITNPASLLLHGPMAGNRELVFASKIQSLTRIDIQAMPSDYHLGSSYSFDAEGVAALTNLTHLSSLAVACTGLLAPGTFRKICELRNLQQLTLLAAYPPPDEYAYLTNLSRLSELRIVNCPNFTDSQLGAITNMTALRHLELREDGVTRSGTNLLSAVPNLKWEVLPRLR